MVKLYEGDGDNECEADFSKNAGEDEVENSESGEIGLDGSLRSDKSLKSFSPDNLLLVIFSKSLLVNSHRSFPFDGNELNCTFSSSYSASAQCNQFLISWNIQCKGSLGSLIANF